MENVDERSEFYVSPSKEVCGENKEKQEKRIMVNFFGGRKEFQRQPTKHA